LSSGRLLSETLTIDGPAGGLEALLEESQGGSSAGFAVVCHPHPLHGGTLQNKVVHTLARALQELGIATLRFNFRGVGASAGHYDAGRGELDDALAVIAYGRARWPDAPLTLAGFSFGALVVLLAAPRSAPARLITVAPPANRAEFDAVVQPSCPWLIVQGDADEIVDFKQVEAFAARFTPPPQLRLLPGVTHLFDRHLSELRDAVTAFVTAQIR
jgi:alpha/beta superfamily hydrolase